ncbi:hypothetical protein [Sorangium sp. So ce1151]|uniref:hypothetical protein n=1 Tax=Sorangium sp. So ce1151 TaxID=3133332 RepID=UPI003F5F8EED
MKLPNQPLLPAALRAAADRQGVGRALCRGGPGETRRSCAKRALKALASRPRLRRCRR